MVYLVSDEFYDVNNPGGGELNDLALVEKLGVPYEQINSRDLVPSEISPTDDYIIGNFLYLKPETRKRLQEYKNYIIYEKDHKYCVQPNGYRNPLMYPDGIVPKEQITYREFYENAKKVICLTSYQENFLRKNINCNSVNIHGSIWSNSDLDLIDKLRETTPKIPGLHFVYNSQQPHKNVVEAYRYCSAHQLEALFVKTTTREDFLTQLAKCEKLVFFPLTAETCSRLIVEAKMLGLKVITNKNSGAVHEDWISQSGKELVNTFRNKIIPQAIEIFKKEIDN